jgi:hypothetical protein
MGWLFMSRGGMAPFATPKAYLDNQCTYPPDPEKGRATGLRVLNPPFVQAPTTPPARATISKARERHSRSSASSNGTPARRAAKSSATRT